MKKLMVLTVLCFSLLTSQQSSAQVNITVNFGIQPTWGPVGYDYVEYYYLPDIDAYYYVPQKQFIYISGGHWMFSHSLPPRYRGYNLYNGYKVVVNEPKPYLHHTAYREKYREYKGWGNKQAMIRDSHDQRYKNNKPHYESRGKGNGKSKGNGKGHENGKGHGKHG